MAGAKIRRMKMFIQPGPRNESFGRRYPSISDRPFTIRLIFFTICFLASFYLFAQQVQIKTQDGFPEYLTDYAFHPEKKMIALLDLKKIKLFDISTGLEMESIDTLETLGAFFPHMIGFSADGENLYVIDTYSNIVWWSLTGHKIIKHINWDSFGEASPECITVSQKSDVYIGHHNLADTIHFHVGSLTDGSYKRTLILPNKKYFRSSDLSFSEDGLLMLKQVDNTLKYFDLAKGKEVTFYIYPNNAKFWYTSAFAINQTKNLAAVASSKFVLPDGSDFIPTSTTSQSQILADRSQGKLLMSERIDLISLTTGEPVATLKGGGHDEGCVSNCHNGIRNLVFSVDGTFLISADSHKLIVWDIASQKSLYSVPVADNISRKIKLSPKGDAFAVDNFDNLTFYSLPTGIELSRIKENRTSNNSSKVISYSKQHGTLTMENAELGIRKNYNLFQNSVKAERIPVVKSEFDYKKISHLIDEMEKSGFDLKRENYDSVFWDRHVINNLTKRHKDGTLTLSKDNLIKRSKEYTLKAVQLSHSPPLRIIFLYLIQIPHW
jgi:hypothetical protein